MASSVDKATWRERAGIAVKMQSTNVDEAVRKVASQLMGESSMPRIAGDIRRGVIVSIGSGSKSRRDYQVVGIQDGEGDSIEVAVKSVKGGRPKFSIDLDRDQGEDTFSMNGRGYFLLAGSEGPSNNLRRIILVPH